MIKTFLLEKNMTLEKICINCIHCISMSINELRNSKVRLFLQVFLLDWSANLDIIVSA